MPAREPVVSEDERKQMMSHYYRRQEELKVSFQNLKNLLCSCLSLV